MFSLTPTTCLATPEVSCSLPTFPNPVLTQAAYLLTRLQNSGPSPRPTRHLVLEDFLVPSGQDPTPSLPQLAQGASLSFLAGLGYIRSFGIHWAAPKGPE